jgi:hypothetical protein
MKLMAIGAVPLFLLATGCASWQERLVPQAAFDLNCPESQLNLILLGPHTAGVNGCGKRATYIDLCRGPYGANCQWIMNNKAGPLE